MAVAGGRSVTIRFLGCALQDPDPRMVGPVLDDVPAGGDPADAVRVHAAWREAAERRLAHLLASGALKLWLPVAVPTHSVLPIFGGTPADDWVALASMVLRAASLDAGDVRIVDFTATVADLMHPRLARYPGTYVRSELGRGGSIDPLLGIDDPHEAIEVLADVVRTADDRSGRNTAAKAQNLLLLATGPVVHSRPLTLGRVLAAVECALHGRPSAPGVLTSAEADDVVDTVFPTVQQHPATWDQLFELESVLRLVEPFAASRPPYRSAAARSGTTSLASAGGTSRGRVAVQSLSAQARATSRELATDLLAARLVRDVRVGDPATTVVVFGADQMPERMVDDVVRAASTRSSQVIMAYERLTDATEPRLGGGGHPVAGLMRLANHRDAERAADYLGKEHSFVLAGVSDSRSASFEWGWSSSTSTSLSTTTNGSMTIARDFSLSTSQVLSGSRETAQQWSRGSATSSGRTVNVERVYEDLLEPSVFQGLGPGALLLVDAAHRASRLTSCARDVVRSPLVAWDRCVEIGDG